MRQVWEDKFQTDFDNDSGDNEANIGLDIYVPDEIDNGGDEDSYADESVVHGLCARSGEDGRVMLLAGAFQIYREGVFGGEASEENDDSPNGELYLFGFGDFLDSFDDDMDTGRNNNEGNGDSGDTLDFGAFFFKFFMAGELFASDDEDARN